MERDQAPVGGIALKKTKMMRTIKGYYPEEESRTVFEIKRTGRGPLSEIRDGRTLFHYLGKTNERSA